MVYDEKIRVYIELSAEHNLWKGSKEFNDACMSTYFRNR